MELVDVEVDLAKSVAGLKSIAGLKMIRQNNDNRFSENKFRIESPMSNRQKVWKSHLLQNKMGGSMVSPRFLISVSYTLILCLSNLQ
jgi:hypothetical protein